MNKRDLIVNLLGYFMFFIVAVVYPIGLWIGGQDHATIRYAEVINKESVKSRVFYITLQAKGTAWGFTQTWTENVPYQFYDAIMIGDTVDVKNRCTLTFANKY